MKVGDLVKDKEFPKEHGVGVIYKIKDSQKLCIFWSRMFTHDHCVLPHQIEKINTSENR